MSGLPPQVEQAIDQGIDTNGLTYIDDHTVQDGGNGSLQACIPAIACRNLGVTLGDGVETYLDTENNAVIHVFGGE